LRNDIDSLGARAPKNEAPAKSKAARLSSSRFGGTPIGVLASIEGNANYFFAAFFFFDFFFMAMFCIL